MFAAARETHLYILSLSELASSVPRDTALSSLSARQMEAYSRIKVHSRRKEYVSGRYAIKQLISRFVRTAPDEISLDIDSKGKPRLASTAGQKKLAFNISHSADLLLIALGEDGEIGVDVEWSDPRMQSDAEGIADRHFLPEELRIISRSSGSSRLRHFYRMWTL